MEVGSAFVSLIPSARGFGSKMESEVGGEVKGSGKRLGASFGKMFALAGGVLAAAGIGSFLKDSLGEAREAQKVGALTESIIKSTGGAAKVTAGQVGALAEAISNKTGIDDEAIQSGANLLLTFKNVRNEVGKGNKIFDRATQAATDLSAAGFGDMAGQSKMLGKALNDPIKGITALSRSGVTFSESQKEQIKSLVESGKTLKAQKIILGEVESQVGGAAAATATYGEKASVAFGNLKEQVGTELLIPAVDALSKAFLRLVPSISKGVSAIKPAFASAQAFLAPFIAQVQGFFGGSGGSAISGFATQVMTVFKAQVLPVLQTASNTFRTVLLPAITSLVTYVASALLPVLQQVGSIVMTRVIPILSSLAQFFYGSVYPAVIGVATAVAKNLRPVFDALVTQLQSRILPAVNRLLTTFQKYQPTIQKVIGVVIKVIGKVLEFAAAILGKVLPVAIRLSGFLSGTLVNAMIKVVSGTAKVISKIIAFGGAVVQGAKKVAEFQQAVSQKIAQVVGYFANLPGRVMGFLNDLASKMYAAGVQLMKMLGKGITDTVMIPYNALKAAAKKLKGLVPGSPVKDGPLRSFNGGHAGRELMNLLALGINQGASTVERAGRKVAKSLRELLSKGVDKKFVRQLSDGLVIDWAKVSGLKGKGAEKALEQMGDRLEKALGRMKSKLQKQIDGVKSTLDSMKQFASSVASAFKVDLFSGTLTEFFKNGMNNNATLKSVLAGFKKLVGAGYNKNFLSQLIQSGNSGLLLELANADAKTVSAAQGVWATQNSLTSQLGTYAAEFNSGQSFKGVEARLDKLNDKMRDLPKNIGDAVGKSLKSSASNGKRNQRSDR